MTKMGDFFALSRFLLFLLSLSVAQCSLPHSNSQEPCTLFHSFAHLPSESLLLHFDVLALRQLDRAFHHVDRAHAVLT